MSQDLVPMNEAITQDSRRAALLELNQLAATTDMPGEAHGIMLQGRMLAELLASAKLSFDEAWLAGKASVIAARRLGRMFGGLPARAGRQPGKRGSVLGPRGLLRQELQMSYAQMALLVRLSDLPDPEFQRFIQSRERVPSINGALAYCRAAGTPRSTASWQASRRKKAGVKKPKNPSFDEGYSLIVRALGHLSAAGPRTRDLRRAIDHLYAAEDLLKPYRGGYVK